MVNNKALSESSVTKPRFSGRKASFAISLPYMGGVGLASCRDILLAFHVISPLQRTSSSRFILDKRLCKWPRECQHIFEALHWWELTRITVISILLFLFSLLSVLCLSMKLKLLIVISLSYSIKEAISFASLVSLRHLIRLSE